MEFLRIVIAFTFIVMFFWGNGDFYVNEKITKDLAQMRFIEAQEQLDCS
jgi:hypothetical protein